MDASDMGIIHQLIDLQGASINQCSPSHGNPEVFWKVSTLTSQGFLIRARER